MAGGGGEDLTERTFILRAPLASVPRLDLGHYLAFTQDGEPRRVPIGPGGLTIGRVAPNDLVIASPDISRRHCKIEPDGEGALLTDLGSTNGSFVGGERAEKPVRLGNGTRFTLGSFTMTYERRDRREVAEEEGLAEELRRAMDYVRAILPQPIAEGPVRTDWWFVPSSRLGGDAFGYQFLDDRTFAGFVLDVSGHGIGSSMHAANVANALRRRALPGVDFRDPAAVAAGLNAMFPMEEHNGLMLTLWYFVYDAPTRGLRFCAAGHHPAYLLAPGAREAEPLWVRSPAIGMLPGGRWSVGAATVAPGSRLYVFSDGAFEIVPAGGGAWGIEDLRRIFAQPEAGAAEAQRIYQAVRAAAGTGPLDDDFSLLAVRFA